MFILRRIRLLRIAVFNMIIVMCNILCIRCILRVFVCVCVLFFVLLGCVLCVCVVLLVVIIIRFREIVMIRLRRLVFLWRRLSLYVFVVLLFV